MSELPKDLTEKLRMCTSFPSPPPVAVRVIELAQDPDIGLGSVADVVSQDPAIALKVMKIANSALYARRRKSSNLRQALVVLGLNATLTLALSFTLVTALRPSVPRSFDFLAYWRRAVMSATWAKILTAEAKRGHAEEAFLGALLQDIGMLAIDRVAPECYADYRGEWTEHQRVGEHEEKVLGADHAAVGAWLLKSWNMPRSLISAIATSHQRDPRGLDEEDRFLTSCVRLSGQLADLWLTKGDEVGFKRTALDCQKYLDISPKALNSLFETIDDQLAAAEAIFEMDLLDEEQTWSIMEMAREILLARNLAGMSEMQDLQQRTSQLENENVTLREESSKDSLTGAFNRGHFDAALEQEFGSAQQHGWPLTLMFVDLDHFKAINDGHGHPAGDLMLREVASVLRTCIREQDVLARYGGDEFVLLLPGVGAEQAAKIADRMVTRAAASFVELDSGEEIRLTLSLGVATQDSSKQFPTADLFVEAADKALYHSKEQGRNRQTCFDEIAAA